MYARGRGAVYLHAHAGPLFSQLAPKRLTAIAFITCGKALFTWNPMSFGAKQKVRSLRTQKLSHSLAPKAYRPCARPSYRYPACASHHFAFTLAISEGAYGERSDGACGGGGPF